MKVFIPVIILLFFFSACGNTDPENSIAENEIVEVIPAVLDQANEPQNFIGDISAPNGFTRIEVEPASFGHYLRNFPILNSRDYVLLYNGERKGRQDVHYAILDLDVGNRDLQQCADAVIRLRAEYLWKNNRFDEINFNFTSGNKCSWKDYSEGYRPRIGGNSVSFHKTAQPDNSYVNFRKYLDLVFTYAGSASLEKEMKRVGNIEEIQIGDVWIKGGFPGHAVIVVDLVINELGEKAFLLAQSYMPAQDMHILKNPALRDTPWFFVKEIGDQLITPEWNFSRNELSTWRR